MTAINFDPNMNMSGNTSIKTIRMTLGLWDYRIEFTRTIGGNMSGMPAINWLLEQIAEEKWDQPISMENANGEKLEVTNDEEDDEWLHHMLIDARIIDVQPGPSMFNPIEK